MKLLDELRLILLDGRVRKFSDDRVVKVAKAVAKFVKTKFDVRNIDISTEAGETLVRFEMTLPKFASERGPSREKRSVIELKLYPIDIEGDVIHGVMRDVTIPSRTSTARTTLTRVMSDKKIGERISKLIYQVVWYGAT
jgi:hypothetical protein